MKELLFLGIITICLFSCRMNSSTSKKVNGGIIYADQHGARGDGRFDNSVILQNLINQPSVKKIILGKGNYLLKKELVINKSLELTGVGIKETKISSNKKVLDISAIPIQINTYRKKLLQGISSIDLEENKILNVEDLLHIRSEENLPELTDSNSKKYFSAKIKSIKGSRIYFDRLLPINFDGEKYPIQITFYKPSTFGLRKLSIISDNTLYINTIRNQAEIYITDVSFSTHNQKLQGEFLQNPQRGVSALGIYGSTDIEVENCSFDYIWYGVMAHEGCNNIQLLNSKAYQSRHINNSGICTNNFLVQNCIAKFCHGGFDSHPGALTSTFINCKDLEPKIISSFRGRRDIIEGCHFEGGVNIITDPAIFYIKDGLGKYKTINNTFIKGLTTISAQDITIKDSKFEGAIVNKNVVGFVDIQDCVITDKGLVNKNDALLTVGVKAPDNLSYTFHFKNIQLVGGYPSKADEKSWCSIGIYIPMGEGAKGSLEDIEVNGFEKGIVLYGGAVSEIRYKKVQFKNISLTDCYYGIYQHDFFDKPIQLSDMEFKDCIIDDNAPHRLKYPKSTKFSSPKKN